MVIQKVNDAGLSQNNDSGHFKMWPDSQFIFKVNLVILLSCHEGKDVKLPEMGDVLIMHEMIS